MPRVRKVARVATSTLWHGKHELTHLLMGLFWLMFLSHLDPEVTKKFIPLALIGSLFPDLEHLIFHFITNRNNPYSKDVKQFLRKRQLLALTKYLEENHKTESYLPLHNIFVVAIVIVATMVAFWNGEEATVVFLGAIALHYVFDMADDIIF